MQVELKGQLRIFQTVALLLGVSTGVLTWRLSHQGPSIQPGGETDEIPMYSPTAPYADRIRELIEPLRYNFLPVLSRPDVALKLDFKNGLWKLTDIHLFDPQGRVALQNGRYGLCGDLAAYTYQRLEPLMEKEYLMRFVRAAESHYFPAPLNTHFVLSIIDRQNPSRIFILDPTFKRYGPVENFNSYLFFEQLPTLRFLMQKDRDNTEIINRAVPVVIHTQMKLSLIVNPENNQFTPENFSIAVLGTRKGTYMPKTIYKVGRSKGRDFVTENNEEALRLAEYREYSELKKRVNAFFDSVVKTKLTYTDSAPGAKKED